MPRTLADLSDRELEAQFVEAERNALAWSELGIKHAAERAKRWMDIAGELRDEMLRRTHAPPPRQRRRGR